jgi:putative ABC transport system permease protein
VSVDEHNLFSQRTPEYWDGHGFSFIIPYKSMPLVCGMIIVVLGYDKLRLTLSAGVTMFKNYLKIAFRNLLKNKSYTFINIFGLAMGIACCVLILLFVRDELSYDRFHEKGEGIYRVFTEMNFPGKELSIATTPPPMAPALLEDFPEIVSAVRFRQAAKTLLSYDEKRYYENEVFFADSSLFRMMNFPLLKGDPKNALANPFSMVITEETARRYFGGSDPMGKIIRYENKYDFIITGILKNIPPNSHIRFDFLGSYASLSEIEDENFNIWHRITDVFTYILVPEKFSPAELEKKFPGMVKKYMGNVGENIADMIKFHLQPLGDIHLHSDLGNEIADNGSAAYVYIFATIAVSVLLIACINFMNLATARAMDRAKEVGMRKVLGAYRLQLVKQFLGESVLMAFLALILAGCMVELVLPFFNGISGKSLAIDYGSDVMMLLILPGIALLTGLLSGSYPALVLSGYKPVLVLKGASLHTLMSGKGEGLWRLNLRRLLVAFQFAISIALIAGSVIIYNQLEYFKNRPVGFDREQIVVIPVRDPGFAGRYEIFKSQLNQNPGVINASAVAATPGKNQASMGTFVIEGESGEEEIQMFYLPADYDFLRTFSIELIAGRDFSKEFGSDATEAFILNESAVKRFGWRLNDSGESGTNEVDSPIGKKLRRGKTREGRVVGVVKDFNMFSLQEKIEPFVFFIDPALFQFLAVKISSQNVSAILNALEENWRGFYPDEPFEYSFVDEDFESHYRSEEKFSEIFLSFTILAILIACLGLFGLVSFTVQKAAKEIGVRKVLGASVSNIVVLMSKDFVGLVVLANVIAWPVAYYAMNTWLEDFAFRIQIGIDIFLLAGGLALFIALLTVSWQAVRAALANPVESLRYE